MYGWVGGQAGRNDDATLTWSIKYLCGEECPDYERKRTLSLNSFVIRWFPVSTWFRQNLGLSSVSDLIATHYRHQPKTEINMTSSFCRMH